MTANADDEAELWSLDHSWPILALLGASCLVWLYIVYIVLRKVYCVMVSCYDWLKEWWEARGVRDYSCFNSPRHRPCPSEIQQWR